MGQKVYLIQAKKISFVETGKYAEYWGARKTALYKHRKFRIYDVEGLYYLCGENKDADLPL